MLKPILRTKSIGTKVTEEEYARLEALAGASGPEYERVGGDVLLAELESKAAEGTEATVLAELLGFRWAVQRPAPAWVSAYPLRVVATMAKLARSAASLRFAE